MNLMKPFKKKKKLSLGYNRRTIIAFCSAMCEPVCQLALAGPVITYFAPTEVVFW